MCNIKSETIFSNVSVSVIKCGGLLSARNGGLMSGGLKSGGLMSGGFSRGGLLSGGLMSGGLWS